MANYYKITFNYTATYACANCACMFRSKQFEYSYSYMYKAIRTYNIDVCIVEVQALTHACMYQPGVKIKLRFS